ncbi:hypothetical protein KSF_093230 [Reticulibacter mediterranei]|uniref:Response regulatory domain-containing protein n=1 Tax=Reticulibacter mediterranei TaxID=2778369 RepID=A0A8J3IVJ9_9CHLR|nr:response regulator [Reticulibacter mediterranei]GHO99275.1 hypothetical protein KSF_093230 [Reticulibacter mediterranei]
MLFSQDESEKPASQSSDYDHRSPPPVAQDLFAAPRRTVLVVDLNPIMKDLIQEILQSEHFHVLFARDTESGLVSIAAHHPQLILLSNHFRRVDGYRLCRMIRQTRHLARLPVILFGKQENTPISAMRGRLAGSTDFLSMPFASQELVQMIKKYLPK